MKHHLIYLFIPLLFITFSAHAQLEKVIVEKYYISDAKDSVTTDGGKLAIGSTTYRVYVDMKPGSKLINMYGDSNHQISFESSDFFFNNNSRGETRGGNIKGINENTTSLDTWLTLGQATSTIKGQTYFGVLKKQDTDGSIIGGTKNNDFDGVITGITGLLSNTDTLAGIPLTTADGLDTMANFPAGTYDFGIQDFLSKKDSTMFGSIIPSKKFVSRLAGVQNTEGLTGVDRELNQVLVAQLTTKGELSFEINITVVDSTGKKTNYVANDSVLVHDATHNEKLSRYMKYPFKLICACPDPDYMEYNNDRECDSQDSCLTKIIFGCMDPLSCNYNPNATFSVPSLCCYPGYCNDRDLEVVCPDLSNSFSCNIYPNPTSDYLNVEIFNSSNDVVNYSIFDSFGKKVFEKELGVLTENYKAEIDVTRFINGLYLLRVVNGNNAESKLFMKN